MTKELAMPLPGQLNPSPRLLLGPGPSDVHPRVLTAMATPLLGHLDPQFLEILNETQEMLRQVFRTKNALTFPISGTGMAGMEACVVNLIEPGDRMLVCINGVFGQRMADVAQRAGAVVTSIERPWGQVFDLEQIRDAVKRVRPKVVGIVHAETSTGAWQPIAGLGDLCHESDALLLLDTVTSLGGVPVGSTPGAWTRSTAARKSASVARRGWPPCRSVRTPSRQSIGVRPRSRAGIST